MLNTDKPISQISEDKLGRGAFAKQLANAIINFQTKENYAVSLQGKWGCGKTSVLNMVIEEIDEVSKDFEEKDRITIIKFNPWNYTDTSQLINQFFLTLTNSLQIDNKNQKLKDVGAAVEKYSSALEYVKYIPYIGQYLKVVPELASSFGYMVKNNAELKLNDVSYRKHEVEKALMELNSRILVVIDDIDRLSNEQIKLIFQLVNAVAGFPNTIYLLSFDKDIVSHALGDVQGCNGQEYLEKIIQVPFDVPPINNSKLDKILLDKLNSLMEVPNEAEFDREHWTTVFGSCIKPFISTLRDVNRYCNMLSFTYESVKEEVDFIDMAGICALQIFASPIFEWIKKNKISLIGGYNGGGVVLAELEEQTQKNLKKFEEIYPEDPQIMLNAIASLFPLFSNSVSYLTNSRSHIELHQAMRIAADSKFDLYFSLSLDNIKISRKEVDNSLLNMHEEELRTYIISLNERNLFSDYLGEVRYNLSRIPESRLELIANAIAFQGKRNEGEERKLLDFGIEEFSIHIISDLLFRISDENIRYNIVVGMFSNTNFESFQVLFYFLHTIELSYGRVAETSYIHQEKLITLEHLSELEKIFVERTRYFLTETNLLDWRESQRACFLWEFIDKQSYTEYMNGVLSDDIPVLKYLSIKAQKWTSSDGLYDYKFDDKSYMNFIDDTRIIDILNRVRFSDSFWSLDKKVIETSAAFVLNTENDLKYHEVRFSEMNKLIDKWKKEFRENGASS